MSQAVSDTAFMLLMIPKCYILQKAIFFSRNVFYILGEVHSVEDLCSIEVQTKC